MSIKFADDIIEEIKNKPIRMTDDSFNGEEFEEWLINELGDYKMSREYEEHFSQTEAMTPAEERLFNFLEDNFIEPLWSVYSEEKRSELDELISALKEEFYLAGKTFQKQKDKQKMEDIIDDAENFCGRDGRIDGMCIGICSECDECCKSYFGLKKGMEKYFK